MKVAYSSGVSSKLDFSRGIGTHTQTLNEQLVKLQNKNFEIVDDSREADITHITKFHPFFVSVPLVKPTKKVVLTIHDLIQLIYPEHYPPGIKGSIKFLINKYLIGKNVDLIITISETSKKDIIRFLNADPKKVKVVYLGSRKEYKKIADKQLLENVRKKFNLSEPFVFNFGDINYNKNIPTLLKACKKLGLTLVLGGKQAAEIETMDLNHPENSHLKEIYKDLMTAKKVRRLGYISDEDASAIYNLASVYVQPSYYEGFGLSVVHAFSSECPVIASKTQTLMEIGEGACLFFNPKDVEELAEKIKETMENKTLRNQLIASGKVLVKNYSWEKCAEETKEVYKNV